MTFSIIVAAYNRKDILIQAIEKIMATDYPVEEYEIIVGDNNSTDGTRERVEEFVKANDGKVNLKYLVEMRKGNVYARHSAVKHAIGKYLVFCDDDCLVEKNWLTEMDRVFRLHPQIALLGTRIEILWDSTPPKWIKQYQYALGEIRSSEPIVIQNTGFYVNSGSMAIARDFFLEIGGTLPEQVGGHYVGDGETGLCRKLHKLQKPIALTNNTFVYHYQIAAKNARLSDMKRRFQNNGVCDAYNEVYRLGIKSNSMANQSKYVSLKNLIKSLVKLKREDARLHYFQYYFYKKKAEYIKVFVSAVTNPNKDWELNDNYLAPDLVCSSKNLF